MFCAKALKVLSLARSVPKPLSIVAVATVRPSLVATSHPHERPPTNYLNIGLEPRTGVNKKLKQIAGLHFSRASTQTQNAGSLFFFQVIELKIRPETQPKEALRHHKDVYCFQLALKQMQVTSKFLLVLPRHDQFYMFF